MTLLTIRPVDQTDEDITILIAFMQDLAAHDGHSAKIDKQKLTEQLFYPDTNVRAFLGIYDNNPVGFILFYECFTVYGGERGLYIPGAFISDDYRGRGFGRALFKHVANYALQKDCHFLNWLVEASNQNAMEFYGKMNAQISKGWNYVRLSDKEIKNLAQYV